ncbi:Arm DNA-binding domain-containing protein [Flavobacterium sp.]|jgi:integrase|uniref:Arm DNA-binding domain-containing protein n=1 Tax=Flavobacterium sp. TaxID=239 RepID=UPI0037C14DC7
MGGERKRTGVRAATESSISIDFTYNGIRCKERLKLKPTAANLKRAEQHRAAILHAIERGTFDYAVTFPDSPRRFKFIAKPGAQYLLSEYLETWVEGHCKHLKASSLDDYKKIVYNTLIPAFGEYALPDLRRPHVREWCDLQTAGNKRLANVQSVLRKALQDALDDDLIESNPLFGWTYSKKAPPKRSDDIDPFSVEEREAILRSCRDPQHKNLFQFAFWTGLRTSELVGLEWGDIDWIRGIVRIERALTQASDEPEDPKTVRSARDVKLLPAAIDALKAQKQHSFIAGSSVFLNPRTKERWSGDQPIRHGAWVPALRLAGVRYRWPYQTRHTYASMMLSAGEPPIWVAQQMGHSDLAMIFRRYARWMPDVAPDAGMKAAELFDKKVAEKWPKHAQK